MDEKNASLENKVETYSGWFLPNLNEENYHIIEKHQCKYRWKQYLRIRFQIAAALNPHNKQVYVGMAIFYPQSQPFFIPLESIEEISKYIRSGNFRKILTNKAARKEVISAINFLKQQEKEIAPQPKIS